MRLPDGRKRSNPPAELEYVSDCDGGFKRPWGRCKLLTPSCPKMRTEPKARILEAFSKFAETSRRGTGSAIGAPEQSSPPNHPFRPA